MIAGFMPFRLGPALADAGGGRGEAWKPRTRMASSSWFRGAL